MGKTVVELSMSLDGFIAGPNDSPDNGLGDGGGALFAWFGMGNADLPLPGTGMVFKVSRASADFLNREWGNLGAMVVGRRTFDIAHAWGGNPPGTNNCFVMTHHPAQEWIKQGSPFTFVTDGIENALRQAQAVAGEKDVSISSASIMQQCLKAGLLDEIIVNIAPVLLGKGVRLFEDFGSAPVQLEQIEVVIGIGVTHIKYRVVK